MHRCDVLVPIFGKILVLKYQHSCVSRRLGNTVVNVRGLYPLAGKAVENMLLSRSRFGPIVCRYKDQRNLDIAFRDAKLQSGFVEI